MQNLMTRFASLGLVLAVLTGGSSIACRRSAEDGAPDFSSYHPEPTPANDFERQMKYIRSANFKYVWVFTRTDGQKFTKEDGDLLHKNAPKVVDWIKVDDGIQYLAGSNFPIDPPQMAALKKRFKVEDYSGK